MGTNTEKNGEEEMIKVFVGTDDLQQDAEKVLEYSIRTNTKDDVNLTFMRLGWQTPPTGFSSHRYLIPKLCNYKGYAIYLDVDMLVLGDLSELWNYKTKGKWCITHFNKKNRDEVSVIDCSAFRDLPKENQLKMISGKQMARSIINSGVDGSRASRYLKNIPKTWNHQRLCMGASKALLCSDDSCDGQLGETKLIHYTNLRAQPWCPDPTIDYMPYGCTKAADLFFEYLDMANK